MQHRIHSKGSPFIGVIWAILNPSAVMEKVFVDEKTETLSRDMTDPGPWGVVALPLNAACPFLSPI